jgi:hypothetical protein
MASRQPGGIHAATSCTLREGGAPQPVEPAAGQLVQHGVGARREVEVERRAKAREGLPCAQRGLGRLLIRDYAAPCTVPRVPAATGKPCLFVCSRRGEARGTSRMRGMAAITCWTGMSVHAEHWVDQKQLYRRSTATHLHLQAGPSQQIIAKSL